MRRRLYSKRKVKEYSDKFNNTMSGVKSILNFALEVWVSIDRTIGMSSNGRHYGLKIFKPEKNLEFFRLKF